MKRLTKYICGVAHGEDGISESQLTGVYCRGQFEATALVERLAAIEDILGKEYDLDRMRELVEADRTKRCVILPNVGKRAMKFFADDLRDVFAEWDYEDRSVGINGMTKEEKELARAIMSVLEDHQKEAE